MDAVERCGKIRKGGGGRKRQYLMRNRRILKGLTVKQDRSGPIFPIAMNDNVTDGGFYYLFIYIISNV